MKRYIRSAQYSNIPTLEEYFREVDPRDRELIQELMNIKTFNGKLFSAPSSRNNLGKTNDYEKEDKCIHLVRSSKDSREYSIPYTQRSWRAGYGSSYDVYVFGLTCYNDGSFQFGSGKIRRFGDVSNNTLSNDVYKAMNSWLMR